MAANISRFSRSFLLKTIAFATVVSLITVMFVSFFDAFNDVHTPEAITTKDFVSSGEFSYVSHLIFRAAINKMQDPEYNNPDLPDSSQYIVHIRAGEQEYGNSMYTDRKAFEDYGEYFLELNEEGGILYKQGKFVQRFYNNYDVDDTPVTAYLSFKDSYITMQEENWSSSRRIMMDFISFGVICLSISGVLVIYLMVVVGRKPQDDQLHLVSIDHIFTDLPVVALAMIISGWCFLYSFVLIEKLITDPVVQQLVGVVTVLAVSSSLYLFLLLVKKIKAKRFWKDTIIVHLFRLLTTPIKAIVEGSKFSKYPFQKAMYLRGLGFIVISAVLAMLAVLFAAMHSVLFLAPLILELFVISWFFMSSKQVIKDMGEVIVQVDAVNMGDLGYKANIPMNSPIYGCSQKINSMGDGMQRSLEAQIKSEMMKVALVTNVSHDLKTPLTSIISYIDLLAKEQTMSDEARDYVKILAEKADRLKRIVSDLFDLAKSTSGNINIEAEKLDFKKLIEQTLADMDDQIVQSNLTVKQNFPVYDVYIMGDGNKLYRVLQNILGNALKYALQGTRVYIDLQVEGETAVATIKNTASYEMDFTKEEILERFTRGDKARSSEGNGLGLSIAESFTKVCGGNLDVIIDGDQFKVELRFHIVSKAEESTAESK